MEAFLRAIINSPVFVAAELFLCWFPVVFAFLAINGARQFFLDRRGIVTQRLEPGEDDISEAHERWPVLSVLIAAHNEIEVLDRTLEDVTHLAWPNLDIVVVDDGSTDGTGALLDAWAARGLITVVHQSDNSGKAAALNRGLAHCAGEIVLVMDADAEVPPETAALLAAQLDHHDGLAAVTGNPRMLRTERLIEKMQAIEFSATVSTQRRGHSAWGRVSTMSGIATMFRTAVLRDIGAFDPRQPAEDIELTWRLQCAGWRVGYEPHAIVGTYPAGSVPNWFRQRSRWARGLVGALRRHGRDALRLRNAPMWPLLAEAVLSIVWCHLLVALTIVWIACLAVGIPPDGNSLILGPWGTFTVIVALGQILWGMHLDREDDPTIARVRFYAPLYPLMYWWGASITVVATTIPYLLGWYRFTGRWKATRAHTPTPLRSVTERPTPSR